MSTGSMFTDLFTQNGRLNNEFETAADSIGQGSFGQVFQARHKVDKKNYAIKSINVRDLSDYNDKIREITVWAQLDCEYFVQYRSSWLQTFAPIPNMSAERAVLYIKMDLCSFSLTDASTKLRNYFQIDKQLLQPIAQYIVSQLLIEILESIDYLHKSNPPIIHRDIKPDNILIKYSRHNARFIKIADFGLAVAHDEPDQSHTQCSGTYEYMAQEVKRGRKYDTSADVYSIGIVAQKMFNFSNNSGKLDLPVKYPNICELNQQMVNTLQKHRPTCEEVLNVRNLWATEYNDIKDQIFDHIAVDQMYDIDTQFVLYFLKMKYNFHNNKN